MGNKSISNRLTEEVRKLLFSESLTDKVVGFEIGLITYHGWFDTLDVNGKTETLTIDENGLVVSESKSKEVEQTFQEMIDGFYINKIIVESRKSGVSHEQMQLIDQIFFDVEIKDYDEICNVARVADRKHLLGLPVFKAGKQNYGEWKKKIADWYKSKYPTFRSDSFSYVFFLICRSSKNGSKAAGSLFMVLNLDRLTTRADLMTFLARCHTLRISLNFLIEHQYGRDIATLLADPIKNKIAHFFRLTIIQPPKGNKEYGPGWFSGSGQDKCHNDDDVSQRSFLAKEMNYTKNKQYSLTEFKRLFQTSVNPENEDIIINNKFASLGTIPFDMFRSLLAYFMVDKTVEFECDQKYIGLPCTPGWVFAAGLVILIHNLALTTLKGKTQPKSMNLSFTKNLIKWGGIKRWNWSVSLLLLRDNDKDGASGLVKSLYYGKRKGVTAQNLHDFSHLRLNSQEFSTLSMEFNDEPLAKLLIKGADSPIIYYNIEDVVVNMDGSSTNYIAVKINWESPVHIEN